jgi:para-aminobenzoate synthetase component I
MRKWLEFEIDDLEEFGKKLLYWGNSQQCFVLLNSNRHQTDAQLYNRYELIAACAPIHHILPGKKNLFEEFKSFNTNHHDWIFGYLSYDLKTPQKNLHLKILTL